MMPDSLLEDLRRSFFQGLVIPALPLAVDADRRLDERRQRALIRYYVDAGAGGIAVADHFIEHEIRRSELGLHRSLLELTSRSVDEWCGHMSRPINKIAGVVGKTRQAVGEARTALDLGYHAVVVDLSAYGKVSNRRLIEHCAAVAEVMPIIGHCPRPLPDGQELDTGFWRRFAAIGNVLGIKVAPFDRYRTIEVLRAVCEAGREKEIPVYTGNDDNILIDLLTPYQIRTEGGIRPIRMVGGLMAHWAIWTERAVDLLHQVRRIVSENRSLPQELLSRAAHITDASGAVLDAAHDFAGAIPGIHEVLRRQGLLEGSWCLDPGLTLSPGQAKEIDRVYHDYPELTDDRFVKENLPRWLGD